MHIYRLFLEPLTYDSDINGSPQDPVVCGLPVTEIHSGVVLADRAEVEPPAVLAGGPALLGHSFDSLEGGDASLQI